MPIPAPSDALSRSRRLARLLPTLGFVLTGRAAGVAPYHQRRLLGDALRLGLLLSAACLAVLVLLALCVLWLLLPQMLALLPGPLSLPAIGLAWALAYVVYAGFNCWALRCVRSAPPGSLSQ